MAKDNMRTASLDELKALRSRGELYHDPNAKSGPDLGDEFWANAEIVNPAGKASVHLRVDKDVLEFFKRNGKGHLTRMNAVLRRYMEVQLSKPENNS